MKILDKVHAWVLHMLSPQEHTDHLYNAVDEYFKAKDALKKCLEDKAIDVASASDEWEKVKETSAHLRALRDWYREQQ